MSTVGNITRWEMQNMYQNARWQTSFIDGRSNDTPLVMDGSSRLVQNHKGEYTLIPKSPAYVLGEQVLQPLVSTVYKIWESCFFNLVLGSAGSLSTKNSLPITLASATCLSKTEARWNSCQKVVTLQPGKSFQVEGDRKLAICKSGTTAWNSDACCDHPGPPMHVTVILDNHRCGDEVILYDGPYTGSDQWFTRGCGKLYLNIKNDGNQESSMYVHMENK